MSELLLIGLKHFGLVNGPEWMRHISHLSRSWHPCDLLNITFKFSSITNQQCRWCAPASLTLSLTQPKEFKSHPNKTLSSQETIWKKKRESSYEQWFIMTNKKFRLMVYEPLLQHPLLFRAEWHDRLGLSWQLQLFVMIFCWTPVQEVDQAPLQW